MRSAWQLGCGAAGARSGVARVLLPSWQMRRRQAGAPSGQPAARMQSIPQRQICHDTPTRARGGAGLPAAGGAGPVPGGGGRVCAAAVARSRARRARGRQPGRHAGGHRPSAAWGPAERACVRFIDSNERKASGACKPALQPPPWTLLAQSAALNRCLCAVAPAPYAGHDPECAGAPSRARPRPMGAARRAQAAADARSAAGAQAAWLRAQMGPRFSRRLLAVTREIMKKVGLHDGQPAHRFPVLAGSHLSEVRGPRHAAQGACDGGPPPRPERVLLRDLVHERYDFVQLVQHFLIYFSFQRMLLSREHNVLQTDGHSVPLRCGPTSRGLARRRRSWARPRWPLYARCARCWASTRAWRPRPPCCGATCCAWWTRASSRPPPRSRSAGAGLGPAAARWRAGHCDPGAPSREGALSTVDPRWDLGL